MQNFILKLSICLLAISLVACNRTKTISMEMGSLEALQALAYVKKGGIKQAQRGKLREMGMKETALSLGAQAGLAWRAKAIDNELTNVARTLDEVYNFNALILEHNIIPPVLLEGRNTFNLADLQTIRISDRNYKVAKQAHFITTAPNWRQYLWMDYQRPEQPHLSMLPKTKQERELWKAEVEKGWRTGIEQANQILEENVARIREDYMGMILYRKLLAMNMISPPYVSNTDLGITGDGSELHIDDRVLRITALPTLNTNSKEWRAAVAKDEETLIALKNMEQAALNNKITITNDTWQPAITPVY